MFPRAQRLAVGAVCVLCAAETMAILGYYGAPAVRTALAALIGLLITTGLAAAIHAARCGDRFSRQHVPPARTSTGVARVYRLPALNSGDHDADIEHGRVIRLHRSQ